MTTRATISQHPASRRSALADGAASRGRAGSEATSARSRAASAGSSLERAIMGVPARIMRPRLLLIAVVAVLTIFGLVMIYSASSVESLSENGDAAFYVKRQAIFIVVGTLLAVAAAKIDYHRLCSRQGLLVIGLVICGMLAVVRVAGSSGGGATRWLAIGPFRLQPSEFAKAFCLLAAAAIANDYFCEHKISFGEMLKRVGFYLGIPLALIVVQPDKGTTGIIAIMVFVLAYYAGLDRDWTIKFLIAAGVLALIVSLKDEYSRSRIITMFNPESDEWDTGYQLTRGFYAFATGGLTGVGLGMSRMKYLYLPEAHNDMIFAIVGEELGLVGTLLVVAAFVFLAYQGFEIARNASDNEGRLISIGAVTLLVTQFFVNVLGVLALFPQSGKPMPFVSYGGSAIMSCLILVGLMVNVSINSRLPETAYDRRRAGMTLADDEDTGVGEPRVHAARATGSVALPGMGGTSASRASRAYDEPSEPVRGRERGGASTPLASASDARSRLRVVDGGAGRQRIDLGPDAADRLRGGDSGPTVRTTSGRSGRAGASGQGRSRRRR